MALQDNIKIKASHQDTIGIMVMYIKLRIPRRGHAKPT